MKSSAGKPQKTPIEVDDRYRLIIEGVRDHAIFMLDPDGRVATWNAGAARIKGYRAEEIIGQHFSTFYPPELVERGWPQLELVMAARDGRFEDEGWRIRRDGSAFWANVVITALRDDDGELVGFAKVTRDLTERRKQEEALRQSEERFRLLVEGVTDYALFMLDPDGRVASWNQGAARMKGYEASEVVGKHFAMFFSTEDQARGWPEHELSVAKREGRFEVEGWRIRKDGSRFWANVVLTAVHDSEGQLRGIAKLTRDLTERRQVEALVEKHRRTSEFLAMLGHELRNPLAALRNAVELLSADADEDWARQVITRQVLHLDRIVNDLLDLARIDAGKITITRTPVDLARLVPDAVDAARAQFAAKEHRVAVRLPPEPVVVMGDATRLVQVLTNLLGNAHKYTPPGGNISVSLERDGPYAELRIRDDGIGLSPELLSVIFDPFFQGERTLDRSDGGLGIGLTLVRRLLDLHGGTVSASSEGPGRGSEFLVRMPVVATEQLPASKREPAPAASGPGLKVLVVDDNVDAAETIGMLIDLWGHDARIAYDGPTALTTAAEYHPDLVLLDIGLPGMDGYEVAERLRGTPATLVAMSGYGQQEDVERSRRAGCTQHLVKPVDPQALQGLLASTPRATASST